MTLCASWVRHGQSDEGQELVFATDSRLRAGEAWDMGIKLFDLGRKDCLLCFAGGTARAYPLILHGSNSARLNVEWSNPRLDLHNVLESLCNLFSELCNSITDLPHGWTKHEASKEAEFLFGGWSWRTSRFCIWKLHYSDALEAFTHTALHDENAARVFTFLGDHVDEAETLLEEELRKTNKSALRGALDMEPLRVVARMARSEHDYPEIGGALQVAKVYRSGNNEFFGLMWPSTTNGKPHFLGREVRLYDAPPMRLLDPDSTTFLERLPTAFGDLEGYDFGEENDFVRKCYPENKLSTKLTEAQRDKLQRIFRDTAYSDFVRQREDALATAQSEQATSPAEDSSDEGGTDEQ